MARALGLLATLALASGWVCACSVLVGTSGLSGGAGPGDASSFDASPDVADSATPGPLPASCRALHATSPDAGSGVHQLASGDGGVIAADCDMESFGGGWTRVTPAMILEAKAVQDYAPQSPAHVDVARGTDVHGGIFFTLLVTAVNCGANQAGGGPGHYFLVGELDGWTQIMATYQFSGDSDCWDIFGSVNARSTNVLPFELAKDLIGPQLNMSRTAAGAAIPYDGRTTFCDQGPDNFWNSAYEKDPKSARIVLRRFSQEKPAGLAIGTDCGFGGWKVSDIHVR